MNPTQRKLVKREALQTLIDEHIADTDVASLREIIREKLKTQRAAIENTLKTKYDARIKEVEEGNERLKKENTEIRKAISNRSVWSV